MNNLEHDISKHMAAAIEEAKISLREGNKGFGTVIVKNSTIISKAHDTEVTENDPTCHAEINAIRKAASKIGKDFSGCTLISTHEPCPMCATAIVWAGFSELAFGFSIGDAIKQGRNRIDIPCTEIFSRARVNITIHEGVLKNECSILYDQSVRKNIKKLKDASPGALREWGHTILKKRIEWFERNQQRFNCSENNLENAYKLLLEKLEISPDQAPIVSKEENKIVFHSKNFCPTLEACKILELDTREVCKNLSEYHTEEFIRKLNPKLRFTRNYNRLRPYTRYCEEMIMLED
jgi:tRNA(Arg) A34 adenosine deaminase TadA